MTCEQAKWLSDCLISQCAEKSAPNGARTRILGLAVDDSSRSATTPTIITSLFSIMKERYNQSLFCSDKCVLLPTTTGFKGGEFNCEQDET